MSDNTRIAKNTIFLYFRSFLMMAIGLYSSRVVLQVLGIDDFGLYGAVGSIVTMFTILNGVLSAGTSRFLTFELGRNDKNKLRATFSASFAMHLLFAIILFVALEIIGLWFLNNKMIIPEGREFAANVLFQFSVLSSMFSVTQVPYGAIIIAREKMSIYAYVGIAEAIFKLALIFFLLYVPTADNLIAYAIIIAAWSIGLQIFYRFYCRKHFEETKLYVCKDKVIYKNMLSYSLWDLVGQFCATGNTQGINILINMFFGVTVNAARAVAYQVESAITQFSGNFLTSVRPQITKSYAIGDYNRYFQLIFESGKFAYFLLFLLSLPIFLEAEYILKLWLTVVPDYTVLFLRCVMVITLFRLVAQPLITGIHATGRVKRLNLTSGIYAAGTFLPMVYIFYKLGLPVWTCFVAQGFTAFICTLLEIRSLYKEIEFNIMQYVSKVYLIAFAVSAVACICPALVIYFFDEGFFRLILTGTVSLFSTAITVYFLGINKSVREKIHSFIKQKLNFNNKQLNRLK